VTAAPGASIIDYYEALELLLSALSDVRGEYRRHFGYATSPAPSGYCWFKGMVAPERHPELADWVIRTGTDLESLLLTDLPRLMPQSVLDVGCGNGALLRRLVDRGVTAELNGINLQPRQLQTARRLLAGTTVQLVEGDFLRHDFERRFDLAYLFESAFHMPSKPELCRRLADVLSERGEVWMIDIVVAERAANTFQSMGQAQTFNYVPRAEWQRSFGEVGMIEAEFTDLSRPVAAFLQVSDIEVLRTEYFAPRLQAALAGVPVEQRATQVAHALELTVQVATEYRRLSRLLRGGMLQYVLMRYRRS
jgi:SAM-dependent methyltransferase